MLLLVFLLVGQLHATGLSNKAASAHNKLSLQLKRILTKARLTGTLKYTEEARTVLRNFLSEHVDNSKQWDKAFKPCNLAKIDVSGLGKSMSDIMFHNNYVAPRVPAVIHNAATPRSLQWFLDQKCLGQIPVSIPKPEFEVSTCAKVSLSWLMCTYIIIGVLCESCGSKPS